MQFGVAGVLFIIGALFTEPMPNASWLAPSVVASVLYLFLGATMSAQIMQNIGLAHVPASQASIIMCTESLFAVTFSALFWGETIMWSSLVGFCADLRRRADVGNQADQTVAAPELTIQLRPWMVMGSPLP